MRQGDGRAVSVFICVSCPSFSKYLLGIFSLPGALWAVGYSSESEDTLPSGTEILRREAQTEGDEQVCTESVPRQRDHAVRTVKQDPVCEVQEDLTTKVPRTEQKRWVFCLFVCFIVQVQFSA